MILFLQLILLYKTTKTDLLIILSLFKTKIESAGSLLSLISNTKTDSKQNGKYELFNLEYSEYIKTEFDYKTLDLTKESVCPKNLFELRDTIWKF
jgi:hypothetical protein